jgi:hypothetical protein
MVVMTVAPRSSVTIRNSKDVVVDTNLDIQSDGDAGNNKHTDDGHTDLTSDQEGLQVLATEKPTGNSWRRQRRGSSTLSSGRFTTAKKSDLHTLHHHTDEAHQNEEDNDRNR